MAEKQRELKGIPVSSGIIAGSIYRYEAYQPELKQQFSQDGEGELVRYQQARAQAERELNAVADSLRPTAQDKADIFLAHIDILQDDSVDEQVRTYIQEERYTAEFAVERSYTAFAQMLEQVDDPIIRERGADVRDVSLRLLRLLEGKPERNISALAGPVIVAARDLLPSDTATLDRAHVLGILTQAGNATSHTAIIAKNYGIPAVLGIPELMGQVEEGMTVILDGDAGTVQLEPDAAAWESYEKRHQRQTEDRLEDLKYLKRPLQTADGVRILIGDNIGGVTDALREQAQAVDCVGLFRTEFVYMESSSAPTEEEQLAQYRAALEAYAGKPVLLRTIDIGGDKSIPYLALPKEDNPFLGVRALRLCYERPELFKTQLRAALRASVYGRLEIMFPMVTSLEDIRWAKDMLRQAGAELDREGIPWDRQIPVGIMMEVPSIMMIADQVAREVDFASVGTNDLCQYLTASDRLNPGTARYYQSFHPAMFRLIGDTARAFQAQGKVLSVCGELGGDPLGAPVLVGLGVGKLSMNHAAVARIKRRLAGLTMADMQELASRVLACGTQEEVLDTIRSGMEQIHRGEAL